MKKRPYLDIDINIPPLDLIIKREFIYRPWYKIESFLKKKYVEEGLSIAQIAEQIKCSKGAVRNGLKKFGIPIREACKPHRRPAQVPYGYRKENGVIVPHAGEQKIIDTVKKMVDDGLNYRKICEFLSGIGVPTKRRGKSWHPEMVRRILIGKFNL